MALSGHLRRRFEAGRPDIADRVSSPAALADELIDTANHLRYVAHLVRNPMLARRLHDAAQSIEAVAKAAR